MSGNARRPNWISWQQLRGSLVSIITTTPPTTTAIWVWLLSVRECPLCPMARGGMHAIVIDWAHFGNSL